MRAAAFQSTSDSAPARKLKEAASPVPVSSPFVETISTIDPQVIQRKSACACGGGCPSCLEGSDHRNIQTKLAISTPGDPYEQEADRVADQVLAKPALPDVSSAPTRIQRYTAQATGQSGTSPASVRNVLASSGSPLEPALLHDMEQRFGHDFSRVRVHSGGAAEQSAHEVSALAYTVGNNMVFGARQFAPGTHQGRRLIAHELAHVVQGAPGVVHRQPEPPQSPSPTPEPASTGPGAPYRVDLANPLKDVEAHASVYELLPAFIGRLSQTYNFDEKVGWRLLEWAAGGITLMTALTFGHEHGHGGSARRLGWDPDVTLNYPWKGSTSPGRPAGYAPSPAQKLEDDISFITGGVNQERINASRMASRWALRGDISYQEAMAYLYAQTNMAAYALRTLALSITDPKDDIYSYVTTQGSLSVGELFALAAAADLLSGPAWAALIGQWNYLRHGERRVSIPTFKVGREMRATIPNWHLLLSSRGPLLGGKSTINVGGKIPVEVSLDMSLDEPGIAVGGQVHWSPTPKLTLSPFGRASLSESEGAGVNAGLEVRYDLLPFVGISARLSYRKDDLLSQPEGAAEGLEGRASMTLDF